MKIGILTWFFADNYGARAQCYALQKYLLGLGYDVEVINYIPPKGNLLNLKTCINHPGFRYNPISVFSDLKRHRNLKNNLSVFSLSDRVYNYADINKLNYDFVVLGSDSIFNLSHPLFNSIYFGVGIETKIVTYSPSCEYLDPYTVLPTSYKGRLSLLKNVSVRDNNTKLLLCNNGIDNVTVTLDPTFLCDFKELKSDFREDNYILVYIFSDWDQYGSAIKKYAKSKNCKIVSIGRNCNWADISYDNILLEDWLEAFKHANLVVTDSYHGTIFAIKNQKQFVLLSRTDKIAKIQCLLNELNISKCEISFNESLETYLENYINYSAVNHKIDSLIEKSQEYIRNMIS